MSIFNFENNILQYLVSLSLFLSQYKWVQVQAAWPLIFKAVVVFLLNTHASHVFEFPLKHLLYLLLCESLQLLTMRVSAIAPFCNL